MPRLPQILLFLAALFIVPTTGAQAADAQGDADLRCMAVMARINQIPDSRHQLESLIGGYYYLGRLNAADPALDLAQGVAGAFAKMSTSEFLSETARCEKEMQTQGHAISSIGAAMPKSSQSKRLDGTDPSADSPPN